MRWAWIIAVIVVLLGGWYGVAKYQANQAAAEAERIAAEEALAVEKAAAEAKANEEAAAKAAEEAAAKAAEEAAAAKAAEEAAAAKAAEEAAAVAKAAEEAAAAAAAATTTTTETVAKVFKSGEVTVDNFADALASANIDEATKTTLTNAYAKAKGNEALMPYLVDRLNALLPQ